MKRLLSPLAGLVLALSFIAVPAHANYTMMYEIKDQKANIVLANLIAESLKEDLNGGTVISGSECTTPLHFLEAIKKFHSKAQVRTVGELPGFIRGLQYRRQAPAGEFTMSSIVHGANKKCSLDSTSMVRAFQDGEGVWFDPNSGEDIIAGTCKNVVGPKKELQAAAPQQLSPGAPAPRIASAPQPAAVMFPDVLIFNLFEPTGEAERLRKEGGDSRMIGETVRRAAALGRAERTKDCRPFGVEMINAGASNTTLYLGEQKPIQPVKREGAVLRYEFPGCGETLISVPPGFVGEQMWLRVPREFTKGYLYPLGIFSTKPGELYRILRKENGSPVNMNLVVGSKLSS